MEISVTEAKSQLTELVRRAEAGEDIILTRHIVTRHGHAAARLTAVRPALSPDQRLALLDLLPAQSGLSLQRGRTAGMIAVGLGCNGCDLISE